MPSTSKYKKLTTSKYVKLTERVCKTARTKLHSLYMSEYLSSVMVLITMAFIQLCLPKYRNVSCYSAINSCEILSSLTDSSTCNFWSITLLQNNSRIHKIFSFGFKHSKYLAVDHASYRVH